MNRSVLQVAIAQAVVTAGVLVVAILLYRSATSQAERIAIIVVAVLLLTLAAAWALRSAATRSNNRVD
jgi:hypothetical protein